RAARADADDRRNRGLLVDARKDEGRAVLVALGVIAAQQDIEAGASLPFERSVDRIDIVIAEIEAVEGADHIAVAIAEPARDSHRCGVAKWKVERSRTFEKIILAHAEACLARGYAQLRLAGLDQDRAANGVAAEQRALRTAQDLDAADVAQFDRPAD